MTFPAMGPTCSTCGAAARPGARFCPRCGTPLPAPPGAGVPRPHGTLVDPAAGVAPPSSGRPTAPIVVVALGVVLALLVGAVITMLVVGPSSATAAGPAGSASPPVGAVAGTPPTGPWAADTPPVADALSELQSQRAEDRPAVGELIGSWVPQLSSKRVGDDAEGRTWDPEAVLAEHRALRATHPDARLVWSGDFGSFAAGDFWITLLADPSSTAEGANAWCDSAGFAADHCYAKRLQLAGGADGNTVLRDDPASGSGGSSGSGATTEPVVGDPGWAPGVTGYGTVRPRELNANGNGSSYIEDVTWDSWGGATATGRGVAGWLPPAGSGPDTTLTPAVVVASDLGDCNGTWGYRRVGWYFPSKGDTEADAYPGYDAICTGL